MRKPAVALLAGIIVVALSTTAVADPPAHAPAPPQTSPAGTHEPVFAQRMIGRPSAPAPATSHPPEQHCPSDVHGSSCTRQPPSG